MLCCGCCGCCGGGASTLQGFVSLSGPSPRSCLPNNSTCCPVVSLQEVPMVVVSHDREFLDNLCTKIVETERGVATTYKVCVEMCACVLGGGASL